MTDTARDILKIADEVAMIRGRIRALVLGPAATTLSPNIKGDVSRQLGGAMALLEEMAGQIAIHELRRKDKE